MREIGSAWGKTACFEAYFGSLCSKLVVFLESLEDILQSSSLATDLSWSWSLSLRLMLHFVGSRAELVYIDSL